MSSTGVDRITGVDPSVAIKAPCKVATSGNITLSGAQTVNGVALTETTPKTRVLVRAQTSSAENGIYDVYDTAWQRSDDFNGSRDVVDGTLVTVEDGTLYSGSTWRVSASNPIAIGTTLISFQRTNNFEDSIIRVGTFADLATTTAVADQVVYLKEYNSGTGVGGGELIAVAGVITPNNITTFASATAGVYFKRINYAELTPQMGGCDGNGTTDDTTKLQAFVTFCGSTIQQTWEGIYRITAQINLVSPKIISRNAKVYKEFNGVGLSLTGGSENFELNGRLTVEGYGAFKATGLIASTDSAANGVNISGVRMRINGWLESFYHIGDAVQVTANGNMNRSNARIRGGISNGKGFRCVGTQDDASVWRLETHTFSNYDGGVYLADDFSGRQWEWWCYNEDSKNAAGTSGVYLGKLRSSKAFIYSEEQTLAGDEITIGANCTTLNVWSARTNRDVNNAPTTCVITSAMGGLFAQGSTIYSPEDRGVNVTDSSSRYIAKQFYASSNFLLAEDRMVGDGQRERQINPRSAGSELTAVEGYLGYAVKMYGTTKPQINSYYYAGTRASPSDAATGVIRQDRAYARVNAADKELNRIEHSLDALNGNRADSTITIYVCNDSLAPVASVKILKNGDVELLNSTSAYIARSPNGTRYKLTPPNGGGAATWVVA